MRGAELLDDGDLLAFLSGNHRKNVGLVDACLLQESVFPRATLSRNGCEGSPDSVEQPWEYATLLDHKAGGINVS